MQKFGLIGKTLKHSWSKPIHELFNQYSYDLYEIKENDIESFVNDKSLCGFNVTIPYKKAVIPFLDEIDERAREIGSVNTVVYRNGKKLGFNTDFDGMIYMLNRAKITVKDQNVLILGSGGTSLTAQSVSKFLGAKSVTVLSRSGEINYDNYQNIANDIGVLINASPVGMYPDNYSLKIDLDYFTNLVGVVDVIYNPQLTLLLHRAKEKNIPYTNGFSMLVAQAKFAMERFLDKKFDNEIIERVIDKLTLDMTNIVLIGMPSAGKTSVGKILAEKLNREFIDTDQEIVKKVGITIPEIFEKFGEDYFRKVEAEVYSEIGKLSGKVISTGGGVVKNKENYFPLKQNGKIFYINRDIDKLLTDGRPLSKDKETIKKLYLERKDAYEYFADYKIDNNGELNKTIEKIMEKL